MKIFLRGITYFFAGSLCLFILSVIIPPIFSTTSVRAVINAPFVTISAPIDGQLVETSLKLGSQVQKGEVVARIDNPRVDQSSLTSLLSKIGEVRERRDTAASLKFAHQRHIQILRHDVNRMRDTAIDMLRKQMIEAEALYDAGIAQVERSQIQLTREQQLKSRSIINQSRVDEAKAGLEYEKNSHSALQAKVKLFETVIEAAKNRRFVGDNLDDIADVVAQIRSTQLERIRWQEVFDFSHQYLKMLEELVKNERKRIASISNAEIKAPISGIISTSFSHEGRSVQAGDPLAYGYDCSQRRVVAIFPQRHAREFHVGREAKVSIGSWSKPVLAKIVQIIPHTTDIVDRQYVIPLPPIERRELYAVLEIVQPFKTFNDRDEQGNCDVGRWVHVEVGTGLVQTVISLANYALNGTIVPTFISKSVHSLVTNSLMPSELK